MPNETNEVSITASYLRTIFETDDNALRIVKVQTDYESAKDKFPQGWNPPFDGLTAKGRFAAPAFPGQVLELVGTWDYKKEYREWQFAVKYVVPKLPSDVKATTAFLMSVKGIGKTLAERVSLYYNGNIVQATHDEDVMVASVKGMTRPRATAICEAVRRNSAISEMSELLKGLDLGDTVNRIAARYGEDSMNVVQNTPYRMAQDRVTIFKSADTIALHFNWSQEAKDRISTAIICCLRILKGRSASIIIRKSEVLQQVRGMLRTVPQREPPIELIEDALRQMQQEGELVSAGEWWYTREDYEAERGLAEKIVAFTTETIPPQTQKAYFTRFEEWKKKNADNVTLAENQEKAARAVGDNVLSVLTGGPGTGKTSTLKAIIDTYKMVYPESPITLMAPTGLAAKRMSEACGIEAGTIHRVLGLIPSECEAGFDDEKGVSIDGGLIIVDEFSMVGIHLARFLMDAILIKPDVRVVIVGDVDQLPPVSPGAILRDLIQCGEIKVTKLNRNFRQEAGSAIVDAAYAINAGNKELPYNTGNFKFDEVRGNTAEDEAPVILDKLKAAFADSIRTYGLSQTYVLAPQRKVKMENGAISRKTLLATAALNPILRDIANPPAANKTFCKHAGKIYRVGDRVINLKNTEEVMNGEIGIIVKIETASVSIITVDFDGVLVEYTPDRFGELDLAYAITVHKSQGCEYASVLYPSCMTQGAMLQRNLLYTAVTRAKKNVLIIGSVESIDKAVETVGGNTKRDLLGPRLVRYCERYRQQGLVHQST